MNRKNSLWYVKVLLVGIGAIMAITPFYAPLSVWVARDLHHLDFWKIWKEMIFAVLALVLFGALFAHRSVASKILRKRLTTFILAYISLVLAIGIFDLVTHRVSRSAVVYGWLIDIRPVGFFLLVMAAFAIGSKNTIANFPWRKIVLIPAIIVIGFGLLQITLLPKDILRHIGYSASTITPYQTVDNQPNIVRIESTMRGPNPLGAYLIIIITLLVVMLFRQKGKHRWLWALVLGAGLIVLFGTYSRSAELGVVLSMATLLIIYEGKFIGRHAIVIGLVSIIVVSLGTIVVVHRNYLAQNILFHTSAASKSAASSNSQRARAIKQGIYDVVHRPLGSGIGSAGPASRRNKDGPVRIAENYYLQIGQETGVAGLALFLAINVLLGLELWRQRKDYLPAVLLASLVGITFVNMLSHAWTDDTLAYIWWGLAGLALAPAILKANSHKPNEKTQPKTT